MHFDSKFPFNAKPQTEDLNPQPVDVTTTLQQSWRMTPCMICGQPTSWRKIYDDVLAPVCSEECYDQEAHNTHESEPLNSLLLAKDMVSSIHVYPLPSTQLMVDQNMKTILSVFQLTPETLNKVEYSDEAGYARSLAAELPPADFLTKTSLEARAQELEDPEQSPVTGDFTSPHTML
jgi:hypothetical protein